MRRAVAGFMAGAAFVAVPVALYARAYVREWDRAWGYR